MSNYFNGNGTIGFTCDVCGRELNGCSVVNGMKFCAKCYQETFGKDNQQNEIQQLKQQLEEKDKEIEKFKDFINCKGCVDVIKKSSENQTQLAIQELEKLRNNILINQKGNDGWTSLEVDLQYLVDMIDEQIEKLEGE